MIRRTFNIFAKKLPSSANAGAAGGGPGGSGGAPGGNGGAPGGPPIGGMGGGGAPGAPANPSDGGVGGNGGGLGGAPGGLGADAVPNALGNVGGGGGGDGRASCGCAVDRGGRGGAPPGKELGNHGRFPAVAVGPGTPCGEPCCCRMELGGCGGIPGRVGDPRPPTAPINGGGPRGPINGGIGIPPGGRGNTPPRPLRGGKFPGPGPPPPRPIIDGRGPNGGALSPLGPLSLPLRGVVLCGANELLLFGAKLLPFGVTEFVTLGPREFPLGAEAFSFGVTEVLFGARELDFGARELERPGKAAGIDGGCCRDWFGGSAERGPVANRGMWPRR